MADQKREALRRLSEADFREQVLVPLLSKMGFERVRLRHGADEYGKDITFCTSNPLDVVYYAVVAKVGDISGAAHAKQNLTQTLSTIREQIDQAFSMPIEDPTENGAEKKQVNHVIVWTTGKITGNAKKQI